MAFETRIKVRFADVDRAGIAYYPMILHYCHVAFEEFFEHYIGMPYPDLINGRNLGFPMVHLETDFKRPFEYGMDVRVRLFVERVGTSSTEWDYRFFHGDDGPELAASRNTTVAVDMKTLKKTAIPTDLAEKLRHCRDE